MGLFLVPMGCCFFNLGNVYSVDLQEFVKRFYKEFVLIGFATSLLPPVQRKLMETNLQRSR